MITDIKAILLDLEQTLVEPQTRSSYDLLNQLLHNDFYEYGSSGKKYVKSDITERLPETVEHNVYVIKDYTTKQLSDDCVLANFRTDRTDPDGTKVLSFRTSIWKLTDGQWQMFFHQGTPINN